LAEQIKVWRNKADSELDLNARLHTETAHLQEQIKAKHTLMGEVAQDLLELYDQYVDSVPAELYGSILGLHERLEQALKGGE
jgi:hypothetical protein